MAHKIWGNADSRICRTSQSTSAQEGWSRNAGRGSAGAGWSGKTYEKRPAEAHCGRAPKKARVDDPEGGEAADAEGLERGSQPKAPLPQPRAVAGWRDTSTRPEALDSLEDLAGRRVEVLISRSPKVFQSYLSPE